MSYIGNKPPYVTSGAIVDGTVQQIDLDAALNAKLDSINGTTTRYNYVATAGQTTFSATYTSGSVDVFLNGLKLDPADYTATNGNTIVLGVAASANDIVNIIANYSVPTSGPEASGVTNRYSFNATAGQTTFSAAYTPGNVDVYVNGLRLDVSDFVATNGTTVVLNAAAALNDIVNIVANGTIVIGDAYTQTQVNSLVATKQDALVSGTTIKTIGGQSILGSGDITVGGGGLVLLETVIANNSTTVSLESFSTLYDNYIVICNGLSPSTTSYILCNLKFSGSYDTSTHHRHIHQSIDYAGYSAWAFNQNTSTTSAFRLLNNVGLGTSDYASFQVNLNDTNRTSSTKKITYSGTTDAFGNLVYSQGQGHFISAKPQIEGIRFYMASGNISSGTFCLYGLRNI